MEKQPDAPVEIPSTETEKALEAPTIDVIVPMTQEEYDLLDELGDENETVQAWLKAHGISEGSMFVIQIEGKPDSVVDSTPGNNFLTRIRDASAAWNEARATDRAAEAARSLVAIESEVDARSLEIAETAKEHEPALMTEAEVRELGEEGLEKSGVEPPEEDVSPQAEQDQRMSEALYDRRIDELAEDTAAELRRKLGELEESGYYLQRAEYIVIDNTKETLTKLLSVLGNGDYPEESVRTVARRTVDELHANRSDIARLSENAVREAKAAVKQISATFEQKRSLADQEDSHFNSMSAPGGEPSEMQRTARGTIDNAEKLASDEGAFVTALEGMNSELEELTRKDLRVAIEHMDSIVQDSFRAPLRADELRNVALQLQKRLDSDELRNKISMAKRTHEPMMDHVRASISSLLSEAN